jgi:hypothetical protein
MLRHYLPLPPSGDAARNDMINSSWKVEPIAKLVNSVTPVKTRVQNVVKRLDAGFRRHECVEGILQLAQVHCFMVGVAGLILACTLHARVEGAFAQSSSLPHS